MAGVPIVAYHMQPAALVRRRKQREVTEAIEDDAIRRFGGDDSSDDDAPAPGGGAAGGGGKVRFAEIDDGLSPAERRRKKLEAAQARAVGGKKRKKGSVVPLEVAGGPLHVPGHPELLLGDVASVRSAKQLADELMRDRSLEGVEQLVKFMNDNLADADMQTKGVATLGHIAAHGINIQMSRPGQAHQTHFDFDIISPDLLHIQQAGAIGAALRAITTHTGNRRLVLRACWSLAHMTNTVENKRQFHILGGEATIATLVAVYSADEDIMAAINELKKPAMTGKTHNSICFTCCTIS